MNITIKPTIYFKLHDANYCNGCCYLEYENEFPSHCKMFIFNGVPVMLSPIDGLIKRPACCLSCPTE